MNTAISEDKRKKCRRNEWRKNNEQLVYYDNSICSRPTLKSCSFPIHQPGYIKNSNKLPWVETFFAISLSKKIYDKKI